MEQTSTCSQVHRNNRQLCSPHQAKIHNTHAHTRRHSGIRAPPSKGRPPNPGSLCPLPFPIPLFPSSGFGPKRRWSRTQGQRRSPLPPPPSLPGGSPGSTPRAQPGRSDCSGLRSTVVRRRGRRCARQGQSMPDLGPTGPSSRVADPDRLARRGPLSAHPREGWRTDADTGWRWASDSFIGC